MTSRCRPGSTPLRAENLIAFALLFWELDAGGPIRRASKDRGLPDFQFPQDQSPDLARPGWRLRLVDYLYVSLRTRSRSAPPIRCRSPVWRSC